MKQTSLRRWYGGISARRKARDITDAIEAEVSHSSVDPLPAQRSGVASLTPAVLPSAMLTRRVAPPAAATADATSRPVDLETTVVLPAFAASVVYRRARREDADATVILPPL